MEPVTGNCGSVRPRNRGTILYDKKNRLIGLILIILLIPVVLASTDSSSSSTSSSTADSSSTSTTSARDAASLVYVSSVTLDPEEYFPYETGTVTVTVKNSGTTTVGLTHPDISGDHIHTTNNDAYNAVSYIGPGTTMTYTFDILADTMDGTYFPQFTVSTKDSISIRYPLTIQVDSRELNASITKPDSFVRSASEMVNLTLINPRDGAISNIMVTTSGAGLDITPTQKYIGSMPGESSVAIPFTVIADHESNLTFHITYENGDVDHSTEVMLPIKFENDKTAAVPVVNNIALVSKGTYYDLTGDITNTGITDAKGLVVTVGSPAKGTGTYPEFAIGSLASDDSGSFDLTFTAQDLSSVPLIMTWKNKNGDDYSTTKILDLSSGTGSLASPSAPAQSSGNSQKSVTSGPGGAPGMGGPGGMPGGTSLFGNSKGNGISSFYPVIIGGIVFVIAVVLYTRRTWISGKLKKKQ